MPPKLNVFVVMRKYDEYDEYDVLLEKCLTTHPLKIDMCRYLEENWWILKKYINCTMISRGFPDFGENKRKTLPACVFQEYENGSLRLMTFTRILNMMQVQNRI
jgi:hypothetical protein